MLKDRILKAEKRLASKWLNVRTITEGWVIVNINAISEIRKNGTHGGVSFRMYSGSTVLLSRREADRVLNKFLPENLAR